MLLIVTVVAAGEMLVLLIKVKPPAAAATPVASNTLTPALVKYKVPPALATNANVPDVETVAVPAVTVQTPAPMLSICKLSPAENNDVLTVIVVALALFITMRVPASAATNV